MQSTGKRHTQTTTARGKVMPTTRQALESHRLKFCRAKQTRAVRLARNCHRDYLQTRQRAFKQIRDEAMQDARHWRQARRREELLLNTPNL